MIEMRIDFVNFILANYIIEYIGQLESTSGNTIIFTNGNTLIKA